MKQLFLQHPKQQPNQINTIKSQMSKNYHTQTLQNNFYGHWSSNQQTKYYAFIEKFQDKFHQKQSRRQWKIFKAMSSFIKTRDPNQCRSHHHKMTKNFENIRQARQALLSKNHSLKKRSQNYYEELDQIEKQVKQVGVFPKSLESQNSYGISKTIPICINQTYFDPLNVPKILDIGNLRTDATDNGQEFHIQNYSQNNFNVSPSSFKGFPSTGLLTPTMSTISYYTPNYEENYNQISENYAIQHLNNKQKQRQQKWYECHKYFIKWINKLNELINIQKYQIQ